MIKLIAKIFGFTKNEASIIGRHCRHFLRDRNVKKTTGFVLLLAVVSSIFSSNLDNIGGPFTLNLDPPQLNVDLTTKNLSQIPIDFTYESRGFSWYHSGVDLVASTGTIVRPIMPGQVKEVERWWTGYGHFVLVDHDYGYESLYSHLSEIKVNTGDKVDLSTIIGESGNTGFSTGPHLHLEVRYKGQAINPAEIITGVN